MIFGRLCGWALMTLAILLASGDAVMALGPGEHVGIATGDILTLLAGRVPQVFHEGGDPQILDLAGRMMIAMPAWAVLGPLGAVLTYVCRIRRRRRHMFRRA